MRYKKPAQISPAIFTGLLTIIILSFALFSCKILQKQKGYESYTKNQVWNDKK